MFFCSFSSFAFSSATVAAKRLASSVLAATLARSAPTSPVNSPTLFSRSAASASNAEHCALAEAWRSQYPSKIPASAATIETTQIGIEIPFPLRQIYARTLCNSRLSAYSLFPTPYSLFFAPLVPQSLRPLVPAFPRLYTPRLAR